MEGRRWTFTEFKAYLEEEGAEKPVEDQTRPNHWPIDLEVDSKRHSWLPADWGQGLRTSGVTGKSRVVFVSPEGKVHQNRRDVEKACGRTLEDMKVPDKAKKKEQRAASEAPPQTYWPEWLPLDWTMASKMSSGNMRPYYYAPSGRGFFNRGAAEEYIMKNPSATMVKPAANSAPLAGTRRGKASDAKESRAKRKDGAESPSSTPQEEPAASPPVPDSKDGSAQGGAEGSQDGSPTSAKQASPDADAKAAGAAPAESSHGSTPPKAADKAAAPEAAGPSSAKRPRLDGGGTTDEEVEQIEDGEPGDGFALCRCRAGAAWLVLPTDVISLDLQAIGGQVEAAGWQCSARDERRWALAGSPDLVLYPSGKLLVRSAKSEDAGRIARRYVDEWLTLEL